MPKINCWEAKGCGREPGGTRTQQMGTCPAATRTQLEGVHGGRSGGRACWAVVGTLCGGKVQGTYAQKMATCEDCAFYGRVKDEEGGDFVMTPVLLRILRDDADEPLVPCSRAS